MLDYDLRVQLQDAAQPSVRTAWNSTSPYVTTALQADHPRCAS